MKAIFSTKSGSPGADVVIDYRKTHFAQTGQRYDIVFDAVGKTRKSESGPALAGNGRFVSIRSMTKEKAGDLEYILKLVESGGIKPYIDKVYTLEQVPEAHRYVDSGRKRGNVVIEI